MSKILAILSFCLASIFSNAQTYICWKIEVQKYDRTAQGYHSISSIEVATECFFNDEVIRVNDYVYLTKTGVRSRVVSKDGIVTEYYITDGKGNSEIAVVVEDKNGILRLFLPDSKTDYAFNFYIKNR